MVLIVWSVWKNHDPAFRPYRLGALEGCLLNPFAILSHDSCEVFAAVLAGKLDFPPNFPQDECHHTEVSSYGIKAGIRMSEPQ